MFILLYQAQVKALKNEDVVVVFMVVVVMVIDGVSGSVMVERTRKEGRMKRMRQKEGKHEQLDRIIMFKLNGRSQKADNGGQDVRVGLLEMNEVIKMK